MNYLPGIIIENAEMKSATQEISNWISFTLRLVLKKFEIDYTIIFFIRFMICHIGF